LAFNIGFRIDLLSISKFLILPNIFQSLPCQVHAQDGSASGIQITEDLRYKMVINKYCDSITFDNFGKDELSLLFQNAIPVEFQSFLSFVLGIPHHL
jgi:hypothetical protein